MEVNASGRSKAIKEPTWASVSDATIMARFGQTVWFFNSHAALGKFTVNFPVTVLHKLEIFDGQTFRPYGEWLSTR